MGKAEENGFSGTVPGKRVRISIVWYAAPEGIAVGAVRIYPLQHFAIFVLLLVTSAAVVSLVFLFLLTALQILSD